LPQVADYIPGHDRESCGCQGGRASASRVTFTILYRTPELGAFTSAFVVPCLIVLGNLFTYPMPPAAIEVRFSLANSMFIGLVLFHSTLKSAAPLAGVLTLADRVMVGAYCVVFSSLIVSLTILTLRHSKSAASHAHAHTVWVHTRYLGPLLSCLLFYGTFGAPRSRSA
jgi:hypothetical protein